MTHGSGILIAMAANASVVVWLFWNTFARPRLSTCLNNRVKATAGRSSVCKFPAITRITESALIASEYASTTLYSTINLRMIEVTLMLMIAIVGGANTERNVFANAAFTSAYFLAASSSMTVAHNSDKEWAPLLKRPLCRITTTMQWMIQPIAFMMKIEQIFNTKRITGKVAAR
jgi:hypothetical protein